MIKFSNLPIVLYLASIPLISYGTMGENPFFAWVGFGAIVIAG